jgi:uncharacterized protein YbaR (Trm112 family)
MAQPTLSPALLEILVCPVCHGALNAGPSASAHDWLHCQACGRYYPVQDGIPVMLEQRATFAAPAR